MFAPLHSHSINVYTSLSIHGEGRGEEKHAKIVKNFIV
jgi:hypothetical protein